VIVGDDVSTDGTRAIVQEFAKRYPQTVIPILHEQNIGPTQNYLAVHNRASGEYIAHIDGDDFALPGKLEKQARILDREPKTAFVVHECRVVDADNNVVRLLSPKPPAAATDIDYLMENLCFSRIRANV
jgi:glycosyltransferase involved in cell wall biosynthesis